MSTRIRRLNLRLHTYTEVADDVLRAMCGEAGRFGVYVDDLGTTRVIRLRHAAHTPRPDSELVGVYTQGHPVNEIEDDLLARKRELSSRVAA